MQLDESQLQMIAIDICQTMLGLELLPVNPDVDSTRQLVASVEIRGGRNTVVEVFASDELMARIAEVMFQSEHGSLSEGEVRDAFGEIANMIGGNVKGIYGEEADLSLPFVGQADNWQFRLPDGCLRTTFECCGSLLSIVLREVEPILPAMETVDIL